MIESACPGVWPCGIQLCLIYYYFFLSQRVGPWPGAPQSGWISWLWPESARALLSSPPWAQPPAETHEARLVRWQVFVFPHFAENFLCNFLFLNVHKPIFFCPFKPLGERQHSICSLPLSYPPSCSGEMILSSVWLSCPPPSGMSTALTHTTVAMRCPMLGVVGQNWLSQMNIYYLLLRAECCGALRMGQTCSLPSRSSSSRRETSHTHQSVEYKTGSAP